VPGIALQLQEFVVYVMKRAAHSAILLLKLISFVVKSSKLNERPLTTYIRHFEPLVFIHDDDQRNDDDRNRVRQAHSRVRRSSPSQHVTRLDFTAHEKTFSLRMRPHSQIFRPDVEFESVSKAGVKKINFDTREILKGYVQGVPGSSCHGRMSGEIFDGIVYANNETYFIEPAHRYFSTSQSFDGVIFKGSDVITDNPSHNKTNCAMTDWLYRKMKAIQESARPIETNNPSYRVGFQSEHVSYRRDTNTPALDTCNVLVAADYRFFTSVAGSSETNAISEISLHVDVANTVYRTTDFGFNFRPGLSIVKVRVYTDTSNEWDDSSLNVQSYLDRWSRINHDLFCLAMLFTYRDFSGGVLGLAWVGYPKASGTAGGICQKQARLTSGYRSLNTAIVTLLNFGERVPRAVSTITVAHEFGHNFGSEHDPETSECSPGSGRGGNYIMYARATDGDRPNNDEFSKCSIEQIAAVLESKAQQCFQRKLCF
jgi:disintegrin and metalloproteinase domain-containing protein 10